MSVEPRTIQEEDSWLDRRPLICSTVSRSVGEQLIGTVSRTETWFLLEYPHPPGAKAFKESDLEAPVKAYLSAALQSIPDSRLLLIRRGSPSAAAGVRFFLAIAREREPLLYEFAFPSYTELPSLDLAAILAGDPRFREHLRQDPLWLVCTNGRRDPCCAKWGLPVYQALANTAGDQVWQTSHVGGHRFAANVVCFPHGFYYGRVDPGDVNSLVGACRSRQIHLPSFRGRSVYPPEAQAAEYFLRQQSGSTLADAYSLISVKELSPGRWEVRFLETTGQVSHRLEIQGEESSYRVFESCTSEEPTRQVHYSLVRYEAIPSEGAASE